MNRSFSSLFLMIALLLNVQFAFAQHGTDTHQDESLTEVEKEESFDAKTMIMEHIGDANEWHILTLNEGKADEHHVSLPLPVILKDKDGFHFFMSSSVAHGHEHDGYAMHHGQVVSTKGLERATLFSLIGGTQKVEDVFFDLSISKNVFSMFVSVAILLIVFFTMARSYKKSAVPTGVAKFMEPIVIFIRDEVAIPNIGKAKYQKYLPFLLTVFFFIWFNNLLGLIPFIPGGANLTGNIAVTLVLAVITLIITVFSGNKHYWAHIFKPNVPILLYPIMIPIEIIGIFTKPFALTMRLFANITAGHIMILAIMSLIFIFKNASLGLASVPLALFVSMLELLVAALQAYIFTVLSALYIGLAVEEHHEEH